MEVLVDGDAAAQQHAADDMAGVPGRVLRAVGVHRTTVYDCLKKEG